MGQTTAKKREFAEAVVRELATRFADPVNALETHTQDPTVQIVRAWVDTTGKGLAIRFTYRSCWQPGMLLGYRVRIRRSDMGCDPDEFVYDWIMDQIDEPLGRSYDILVEEDGASWWGAGYPSIDEHPALKRYVGKHGFDGWCDAWEAGEPSPFAFSSTAELKLGSTVDEMTVLADHSDKSLSMILDADGVLVRERRAGKRDWYLEVGLSESGPWFPVPVWRAAIEGEPLREFPIPHDQVRWILDNRESLRSQMGNTSHDELAERLAAVLDRHGGAEAFRQRFILDKFPFRVARVPPPFPNESHPAAPIPPRWATIECGQPDAYLHKNRR
ncbi:MAG: hypothetical protein U0990_03305 [Candidatus Nanopelagicales bacterium]|nr:hypothetical protein [Candidatus Nanopelagicales bacterium]MDZ4249100.1 hypothetical protein [Candidatus Nanopelagicales bacterium]